MVWIQLSTQLLLKVLLITAKNSTHLLRPLKRLQPTMVALKKLGKLSTENNSKPEERKRSLRILQRLQNEMYQSKIIII